MPLETDKYKDLFCREAEEQLATLGSALLALEKDPGVTEHYQELMRSAHTIKGAAATMGYTSVTELAHALEDVFHAAERGALVIDPKIISVLLSGVDVLTSSVASIKEHDVEVPAADMVTTLKQVLAAPGDTQNAIPAKPATGISPPAVHIVTPDTIKVSIEKLDTLMGLFEEMLMLRLKVDTMIEPAVEFVRTKADAEMKQRLFFINELQSAFAEFGRLLSENQDALLTVRLVPLDQIFGQFPRMVRDLALREGKAVEFVQSGGDIALDRTVIEGLGGALAHLLRNAVDHGIVERGTITLSAVREGGRARITVEDTGGGIDYPRVKEVAKERGVGSEEALAQMSNEQVAELLFHPNMSTSEVVTDISGRGVGLSAVRFFAEDVGGHIDVVSPPETGVGTRFTLDLPVSLATVHVLTIQARGYTFAIPFEHVVKTLQFKTEEVTGAAHQETLFVDGALLPLIHLEKVLRLSFGGFPSRGDTQEVRSAVIVHAGKNVFVLEVDACTGEQNLLVKSLPPILRNNKGFSGSALLPDGRTILLLDGHGLLTHVVDDILKDTTSL